MSEDSYLLEPKEKKPKTPYEWFMLFLRISFFVIAFILVVITVLANMGGSEKWHDGVQGFISEFAGGRPVKLGKLNHMGFFPTVRLDIEDVGIYAKEGEEIPLVSVDKFRLGMPFLDVATSSPRITEFYIEDISAIKGVFMPDEFTLEKLFIDHDQESNDAMLRVNGKIGLQSWNIEISLEAQKTMTGKNTYMLAPRSRFSLEFADIHISGTYDHASAKHMKIEGLDLRIGETNISGDINISSLGNKLLKLNGSLDINNGNTVISPDLVLDLSHKDGTPAQISGNINSPKLAIGDISGEESIFGIINRLRELMGYTSEDQGFFGKHNLDLHVFLQNVETGNSSYEALSFDVLKEGNRLRIGEVIGKDEQKLMPALIVLQNGETMTAIMQDGTLDIELARSLLKSVPESRDVSCGIGEFVKEENLLDMEFNTKFETINLPQSLYDFVRASLQKSGKTSPCEDYISLKEPEE